MAISKQQKDELVVQYAELIEKSDALILTEYTGLNVKDMEDLRSRVREADGEFLVTKNTLLKLALEDSGATVPDDLLTGQVATGFAFGEAPTLAKALVDYADKKEQFAVKGGVMQMNTLTGEQVIALAKLPSLDELRAQILGLMSAPARDIVSVLTSSMRQVVNVIDAYSKTEEGEVEADAA